VWFVSAHQSRRIVCDEEEGAFCYSFSGWNALMTTMTIVCLVSRHFEF
jgi:hypothetical protein